MPHEVDDVVLCGLKSRCELNGMRARVMNWCEDKGRWAVELIMDAGERERICVRPENVIDRKRPDEQAVIVKRMIHDGHSTEDVQARVVAQRIWPQLEMAESLMEDAWAADEARQQIGYPLGMTRALYDAFLECQDANNTASENDAGAGRSHNNAAMVLFSLALNRDNPRMLAVLYKWEPTWQIYARKNHPDGSREAEAAATAAKLPEVDYAYEVAENQGAAKCFEWLRKRNATAMAVHKMRKAQTNEAGLTTPLFECAHCATTKEKSALFQCNRCRLTLYCSAECQRAAWPAHKLACTRPAERPLRVEGEFTGDLLHVRGIRGMRLSTVFQNRGRKMPDELKDAGFAGTLGRPPRLNFDPTYSCFFLELRVRKPGTSAEEPEGFLTEPRPEQGSHDHKHVAAVRAEVSRALARRGNFEQLETCGLRAVFRDDGSDERGFHALALKAASKFGASVVTADRRVDPGLGLLTDEDDSAWEMAMDRSGSRRMRNSRRVRDSLLEQLGSVSISGDA